MSFPCLKTFSSSYLLVSKNNHYEINFNGYTVVKFLLCTRHCAQHVICIISFPKTFCYGNSLTYQNRRKNSTGPTLFSIILKSKKLWNPEVIIHFGANSHLVAKPDPNSMSCLCVYLIHLMWMFKSNIADLLIYSKSSLNRVIHSWELWL